MRVALIASFFTCFLLMGVIVKVQITKQLLLRPQMTFYLMLSEVLWSIELLTALSTSFLVEL